MAAGVKRNACVHQNWATPEQMPMPPIMKKSAQVMGTQVKKGSVAVAIKNVVTAW